MSITYEQGLKLFKEAHFDELAAMAREVRDQKNPPDRVTFVLDSNPNYTNVCDADCSFCAFFRHKGAKDAYQKTADETFEHIIRAKEAGLSTVLLQGGLADYPLSFYTEMVERTIAHGIYPHFFTAPEIWNCAKVNGLAIRDVLQALYDAGQRSVPGGGAEIVSERVRLEISPKKMEPGAWLEVHRTAHEVGFRSTATMMYGHVEEPEDILTHLEAIRQLQNETHGFTAFIPWSYKRDRTALRRKVKNWAGHGSYLRILAFSRVYLDNFDHIQATWFSEGVETGIRALRECGSDDFGGIIWEENVHRATGHVNRAHVNHMLRWIRQAGFEPAERNPLYEILRTFEGVDEVPLPSLQEIHEENKLAVINATMI